MSVRVRLSFDEMVPGYSKKIWFLFNVSSCRLVADLEHLIQRKFDLQRNSSLFLYSDGYLLPAQEKIELIRDGDIIRVEQQGNVYRETRSWHDDEDIKIKKKRKLNEEPQRRETTQEEKYKKKIKQLKDKVNQIKKHSSKSTKKNRESVTGEKSKKATKKGQNASGKWPSETDSNAQERSSSLATSESSSNFESTSELSSELSLESSTNTSISTEEVVRGKNKVVSNNARREKVGNGLEQNRTKNRSQSLPSGYISPLTSSSALSSKSTLSSSKSILSSSTSSSSSSSYVFKDSCRVPTSYRNNNVSFLLSSSSSYNLLSSAPSSSTEDSVEQTKRKFQHESSETTSSLSSTPKAFSTDAQDETTSDQLVTKKQKQKVNLNAKKKEKSLDKSKRSKAKINSSTSAEEQVETAKIQFKTQKQERKDDLNHSNTKEKSHPKTKKAMVKILDSSTSGLSTEGHVERAKNQSKTEKGNDVNTKTKEKCLSKNKKTRAKILDSSTSGLSAEGHVESVITHSKTQKENDNLSANTKEKCLPKNKKTRAKLLDSSTSGVSTEGHVESVITPSKTQKENDNLSAKTKEKCLPKNKKMKPKILDSLTSGKEQHETLKNQPVFPQEAAQVTNIVKRNYTPVTGIRNKTGIIPPSSVKNSHIRFDSDEDESISAQKQDTQNQVITEVGSEVPNSTQEHPLSNPCTTVSEQSKTSVCDPLDNGGTIENNAGYDARTKNVAVNYNTCPSLQGPPRVGDRIVYKVLELSASYTPEMSDYKEGAVLGYDPVTNEVQLELTDDSLSKPLGDGNVSTKFELIYEDEEDDNTRPPVALERKVSVVWTSMVDPRLITS